MADGQQSGYSPNAVLAASGSPSCSPGGCPSCVKTGLPILLVRPGLAEKTYATGVEESIRPLLTKVADADLSHSGYAMRTLRRGYVYAYYETPHTPDIQAQDGWQAHVVDDGGYLTPYPIDSLPAADSSERPAFSCERTAGYSAAMLFVVPDAKNTDKVWVAFSEHPWSEKVRENYAASESLREKRMTCINAKEASCEQSVPLTAANIGRMVADYVDFLSPSVLEGNPHPSLLPSRGVGAWMDTFLIKDESSPGRRGERAEDVAGQANQIIKEGGQFVAEDAMIVSVSDAVGITAEAAQLRMTLCSSASQWVTQAAEGDAEKAEWMLMSALSIEGLIEILDEQGEAKASEYPERYGHYSGQRMTQDEFNQLKKEEALPPDARFHPTLYYRGMSREERQNLGTGTVEIPSTAQIERETESLKKKVLRKLEAEGDSKAYRSFLDTYEEKVEEDREKLADVEKDYFACLDSDSRKQVTEYDFDEEDIIDGVYYCGCVSKLTYGGPMTDEGLGWYEQFLTDNPDDKENLLLRALLGNQKSAIAEWLANKKGPYGQLKSIVGELEKFLEVDPGTLSPAGRATLRYLPYFKVLLAGYASPVLAVVGATATGLSKRQKIAAAFRQRLGILAALIGGHSNGRTPPALLTLKLPLPDAARFWRQQMGTLQSSVRKFSEVVRGDRVQSLVLDGAVALEAAGSTAAGEIMVDVYLWASDLPEAIGDALEGAMDLPDRAAARASVGAAAAGRYVLRPASANLNAVWQGAARVVTKAKLDVLARNSVTLASNGTALLAAGSGVFSAISLVDAWDSFKDGSREERQEAATSLLTSGLGLSAAFISIGAEIADQSAKQALKESLKRRAGIVGAVATLIDGIRGFFYVGEIRSRGDTDTAVGTLVQSFLLVGAAGAGVATAMGFGSVSLLGLSITGWGLVLVALGIVVGFIIAALRDTPTEAWAAGTIWGGAKNKWGSHAREQEELNKLLMGLQVDFNFRSRFTNAGNYGRALKRGVNPVRNFIQSSGELLRGERIGPVVTREAWARVMLPKALEDSIPWVLRIVAKRKDGREAVVAYYGHDPERGVFISRRRASREWDVTTVKPQLDSRREGQVWIIVLSAQLDIDVYQSAWAEVVVYSGPDLQAAPLVDQTLQGN